MWKFIQSRDELMTLLLDLKTGGVSTVPCFLCCEYVGGSIYVVWHVTLSSTNNTQLVTSTYIKGDPDSYSVSCDYGTTITWARITNAVGWVKVG